jgi:hypothetical protein
MAAKKKESAEAAAPKKLSFFDFLNSINEGANGKTLLAECKADNSEGVADPSSADRAYLPFMVNRGLSYFNDTVLLANEMNRHAALPVKMQYDFLKNTVRAKKRFSKWSKKMDDGADVQLLMDHYCYSAEKAREVLPLLSESALSSIRASREQGGRGK